MNWTDGQKTNWELNWTEFSVQFGSSQFSGSVLNQTLATLAGVQQLYTGNIPSLQALSALQLPASPVQHYISLQQMALGLLMCPSLSDILTFKSHSDKNPLHLFIQLTTKSQPHQSYPMSPMDFWHQILQPTKLSLVLWFRVGCIEALDVLSSKRTMKLT